MMLDLKEKSDNILFARLYNLILYNPNDINFEIIKNIDNWDELETYINNPKNGILCYYCFDDRFKCFEFVNIDCINWYKELYTFDEIEKHIKKWYKFIQ